MRVKIARAPIEMAEQATEKRSCEDEDETKKEKIETLSDSEFFSCALQPSFTDSDPNYRRPAVASLPESSIRCHPSQGLEVQWERLCGLSQLYQQTKELGKYAFTKSLEHA